MSLESYKISMHSACLHKPRWQPLHATLVNTLPCKSSQSARCQSSIDADSKSGPKQPRRSTLLSTMSFLLISQGLYTAPPKSFSILVTVPPAARMPGSSKYLHDMTKSVAQDHVGLSRGTVGSCFVLANSSSQAVITHQALRQQA